MRYSNVIQINGVIIKPYLIISQSQKEHHNRIKFDKRINVKADKGLIKRGVIKRRAFVPLTSV